MLPLFSNLELMRCIKFGDSGFYPAVLVISVQFLSGLAALLPCCYQSLRSWVACSHLLCYLAWFGCWLESCSLALSLLGRALLRFRLELLLAGFCFIRLVCLSLWVDRSWFRLLFFHSFSSRLFVSRPRSSTAVHEFDFHLFSPFTVITSY